MEDEIEIIIRLPKSHADEILSAYASGYQASRLKALQKQNQPGEYIPGTDQEVVEKILREQLIAVARSARAKKAAKDFNEELK